jgi:dCMP deaminase
MDWEGAGAAVSKPTWSEYYLGIAEAASKRSSCTRSKVGAVVVKNNRVVSLGYNDSPAGKPGCEACPRRLSNVEPGSNYDEGPGRCGSIHAEANSLLHANREDLVGATLYCTRSPCTACSKLIEAAGITDVVYPGMPKREQKIYKTWYGRDLFYNGEKYT